MNKDDGGPAFPYIQGQQHTGMSLRDYFAAAALEGELAGRGPEGRLGTNYDRAERAYREADAMLAERSK